jgi:hypothetical protein
MIPKRSIDRSLLPACLPVPWLLRTLVPFCLMLLGGAGPPEVVRVRVPASKVGAWFPPGSELRGMPLAEFESLVRGARARYEGQARRAAPRILRARHEARWSEGLLIGRSQFELDTADQAPVELPLDPWTPAVVSLAGEPTASLRNLADRRLLLRNDRAISNLVAIDWELQARPQSGGRVFTLGLPRLDVASLVLDLPRQFVPEGVDGIRQRLDPGPEADRVRWRFDGAIGLMDLRLRSAADVESGSAPHQRFWVGGNTRIDVDDGSLRWRADWSVDTGAAQPTVLSVQLDPGLEPIEVTGLGVVSFQASATPEGSRLTIRLRGESSGPTSVAIRAVARAPEEGTWTVPSARPLDAYWIGGRTIVQVGPTRVLADCRERFGRRVSPRAEEEGDATTVAFESTAPRSVAELVFRKPVSEASCEVRGELSLGGHAPRFEARLTWKVLRGMLLEFVADLPRDWKPDRIRILGSDEPARWHLEAGSQGRERLVVEAPTGVDAGSSLTVEMVASALAAGTTGPLTLPRVWPIGARVSDELWVAHVDLGWAVRPTRARGLAWLDPAVAISDTANPLVSFLSLRGNLAWRWMADDAEGQVERVQEARSPRGEIQELAIVDSAQLRTDWVVTLEHGKNLPRSVVLFSREPLDSAPVWRISEGENGPPLPQKPLNASDRAARGLPREGSAWEVELPHIRAERLTLRGRLERGWSGSGPIPVLSLAPPFVASGVVVVLVERSTRSEARAEGLDPLDTSVAWRALENGAAFESGGEGAPTLANFRRAHAFSTEEASARLDLRTERLRAGPVDGVISEAILSSLAAPGGTGRQRLVLRVAATKARALDVTLPPGTSIERVTRDGEPAVTSHKGHALSIPLAAQPARQRFTTIVLDYRTALALAASSGATALWPERPTFSMPCLAFCWELGLHGPWTVSESGISLVGDEPSGDPSDAERLRGELLWPWRAEGNPVELEPTALARLRELDARAESLRLGATTLVDMFTRWDSGILPIVVDREALVSTGYGPRSPISPPRTVARRASFTIEWLRPLGLTVVPLDGVCLITSRYEAAVLVPGSRAEKAWEASVREAAGAGADRSDRLQSVVRWREETTPEPGSVHDPDADTGWVRHHWASLGWPETGTLVRVEDPRARAAWAAAIGLAVVLAALAARRRSARLRAAIVSLALGTGWIVSAWLAPQASTLVSGSLLGGIGALAFGLGRSFRPSADQRRDRSTRSSNLRNRSSGTRSALFLIIALGGAGWVVVAAAEADLEPPILALIPFDDQPDLRASDARVVLLLKDYNRLQSLASAKEDPVEFALEAAVATHEVRWNGEQEALIQSQYALWAVGPDPHSWSIPVGGARDLTASLDGQNVPILVEPGGQRASVTVAGQGRHVLRVARAVSATKSDVGATLLLPINPTASARLAVRVEGERDGIEFAFPSARGRIEAAHEGFKGLLGPADALEIVRKSNGASVRAPSHCTVDSLILWDAEPAGDGLRARLTFHDPGGTSSIRVALGPGVLVRSARVPGLIDASQRSSAERSEWVAHVDPPLPDGARLELDLWRPLETALEDTSSAAGRMTARLPGRRLPRLEPLDVERFVGLVGFRRPADWTGRLEPIVGTEPVGDESFLKAWGEAADSNRPLSGALRFLRTPDVEVATGYAIPEPAVRQNVQVAIEPGRLEVRADAEITDMAARSFDAWVTIPRDMNVLDVEADGLAAWDRSEPDRIHLLFRNAVAEPRMFRLRGWIPVLADPLATALVRREAPMPWPAWPGMDEPPGTLMISASISVLAARSAPGTSTRQIWQEPGPGAALIAPTETGLRSGAIQVSRAVYRVDRPSELGPLRWSAELPRVSVSVRSRLTIHSDSADWQASLRYQVAAGSLDTIFLKLPTAWANQASVEVDGGTHELSSLAEGASTSWTIRLDPPNWGERTVRLRSRRPLARGEAILFPDLVPLGRGTVETIVAVTNATGQSLGIEDSEGLQQVEVTKGLLSDLSPISTAPITAYRVRREGWTLQVRAPLDASSVEPGINAARVALAELECVLAPDSSSVGQARFELESGSGPFLTVVLPHGSEALRGTVNGQAVQPLHGRSGRWLIPLGDGGARRATLVWRSASMGPRTDGTRVLAVPGLDQARVPTLVTLFVPETVKLMPVSSLDAVSAYALELERLERMGGRILVQLGGADRTSARDRQDMVGQLSRLMLQARVTERAAWHALADQEGEAQEVYRQAVERVRADRSRFLGTVRAAGLDDWARAALENVGEAAPRGLAAAAIPYWDPSGALPLRHLGTAYHFRTETPVPRQAAVISWIANSEPPAWRRGSVWALTLLAAAAAFVVYGIGALGQSRWPLVAVALAATSASIWLGLVQPLVAIGALTLALLGRYADS